MLEAGCWIAAGLVTNLLYVYKSVVKEKTFMEFMPKEKDTEQKEFEGYTQGCCLCSYVKLPGCKPVDCCLAAYGVKK